MGTPDKPESQREILRDIQEKTNKMYFALHGDEQAKVPGYFERVRDLENSEKKRGRIYLFISTITAGIVSATHKFIFG